MKKTLFVILALLLCATPAYARYPEEDYKGSWYMVEGQAVRQGDLEFTKPAPEVETLATPGIATRYEYFSDGNYYCAYNPGWDYYICGANDGSDFFCRYYLDGSVDCVQEER